MLLRKGRFWFGVIALLGIAVAFDYSAGAVDRDSQARWALGQWDKERLAHETRVRSGGEQIGSQWWRRVDGRHRKSTYAWEYRVYQADLLQVEPGWYGLAALVASADQPWGQILLVGRPCSLGAKIRASLWMEDLRVEPR